MNRNLLCYLALVLASFSASAQNAADRKKIAEKSNLAALDTLAAYSFKKYLADKEEVKQYALLHPGSEKIKWGKKGFAELMRFTKNGSPIYYAPDNVDAAKSTRTNYLHAILSYNMLGQGMTVGVWDGGPALSTHHEFTTSSASAASRLSVGDGSAINTNSDHGTHVSGTIGARGAHAPAKGMAPKAEVVSHDWNADLSEMATAATYGLLVSNHSYGTPIYLVDNWYPGCYSTTAREVDILAFNAPYYLIVSSAGNDGGLNNPAAFAIGFDKLTGIATAKNTLIVANADDASVSPAGLLNYVYINSSSSVGPTDDYRIKPDITGNGSEVLSCTAGANNEYESMTGTSMASPNVAGSVILLQQYYYSKNTEEEYMRAATLKGLACHTADDAGNSGPDPVFGWGLLNMKAAAETITAKFANTAIIDERVLPNSGTGYEFSFNVSTPGKIIASISWTDPPGQANDGALNDDDSVLINDLDIRVIKDGTTTYLPWKLDPDNLNIATTGDNEVDNIERVEIANAEPGNYVVKVTKKGTLINLEQPYSLIITGPDLQLSTNSPIVADGFSIYPNPASTELFYHIKQASVQLKEVSVFDISGKKINCIVNLNQKIIDVSGLSQGMYFVNFIYEGGIVTRKFVKN